MRLPLHSKRHQTGLALFEILAAMMVLSMSFLGTALLLAKTAKEERSALFMGRAASLASDMAERIRSSPAAIDNYILDQTYASGSGAVTAPACGGLFTAPGAAPLNLPSCGNAAAAAAYDLASWRVQLQTNLPGGVGRIERRGNSNVRTIIVGWIEPALDYNKTNGQALPPRGPDDCGTNFAPPDTVRCYRMEVRL
ncbi:type IV pilus modification protein PilV [Ideonella sp.]|jgi:type IV pilus modification protein PilV|uniref:type IV pilus modification protein PilV n=1 Tax=Ideonella sp. TaxID=1929293 RepID=UPI0037C0A247